MTDSLKLLIVGGYGVFGGRLVMLLEDEPRLTLFVAGRSLGKAEAFIRSRRNAKTKLVPIGFDRDGDIDRQLAEIRPHVLIDASGPFQAYGQKPYHLVEACLANGINYLDLADASDFVAGIGAFDDRARAAGLFILSGVSSFPVLTATVVRRLSIGMASVKAICGGIAPSPYAGVGDNVIRAIASYAGRAIPRRRNGAFCAGHPFTEHRRYTIAPPGHVPLHNRLFSLVDVPDLRALADLWPEAEDIWMGAAPVPETLHRLLAGLAWLVRLRLLPTLSPLAPLIQFATNHIRWGEHRGGMFVTVEGTDSSGTRVARSWHLLAEGDDGPLIPSMAVEAIVRNALKGQKPPPGARAAVRDLELDSYERLFARRAIFTGVRDDEPEPVPLYARILGNAWRDLPAEILNMHQIESEATAHGRARVERDRGVLARIIAALFGFPAANLDVPVRVRFEASNGGEVWTRTFGSERFHSRQSAGRGRSERLLCERFGPLTFGIALAAQNERLALVLRRWSAFGVPLPMWLAPRVKSHESAERGRFCFHVDIAHPLVGAIIRYDGWLVRDEPSATA